MPEYDPIRYRQAGADSIRNVLDERTRRQAGNALATDPAQAATILAEAGMLEDATALQTRTRANASADRTLAREEEDDDNKWLMQGAQGLLAVPYAQRGAVYQSQIRPRLATRLDPEQLVQVDAADMTDDELRALVAGLGGEVASPYANDRAGTNGAVLRPDRYTGAYSQVYAPVFDPRDGAQPGFMWTDETKTRQAFIPGGGADPEVVRQQADQRRRSVVDNPAPSRSRGGGGGYRSSGGGARSSAPAGRPWERSW